MGDIWGKTIPKIEYNVDEKNGSKIFEPNRKESTLIESKPEVVFEIGAETRGNKNCFT